MDELTASVDSLVPAVVDYSVVLDPQNYVAHAQNYVALISCNLSCLC